MRNRPPKLAEWLLSCFLRRRNLSAVMGDFAELHKDKLEKQGLIPADLWYWFQIIKSFPAFIFNIAYWSVVMFKNYLKVTLRNIKRHKAFSFINIFGLAIGLACCLLISLWVLDELSFDRFHKHSDRLFRVEADEDYSGRKMHTITSPVVLAPTLEKEIPEVLFASRFTRFGGLQLTYQDNSFFEQDVRAADPSFFFMFSFLLIKGDKNTALNEPFSIIISERMADKYFADEDPIGQIMMAENKFELTVTGVIQNPPHNSSLQYDWIIPFQFVHDHMQRMPEDWGDAISTYVLVREGSSIPLLNQKITDLILKYKNKESKNEYSLNLVTRMRLFARTGPGRLVGNIQYVYIFSLIALVVLLIACINFMNLSTARSAKRGREIAMRKVVGALRKNIVQQFYGESLLFTLSALFIALILVAMLLPAFNTLSGKMISVNVLLQQKILLTFLGITLFTGFVAGSYPALLLSGFGPVKVLRSGLGAGYKNSRFRQALVVLQFTLSIFLIIGTGVVFNQVRFMKGKELGYDKEHLLLVPMRGGVISSYSALKTELSNNPAVIRLSAMSRRPSFIGDYARNVTWNGKDPLQEVRVIFSAVDYDFTSALGIDLLAGRDFSRDFSTDARGAFLVNEETAQLMDKDTVVGEDFSMFGMQGKIVGVMKNFHFQPLQRNIQPLVVLLAPNPNWLGNILIRISPDNISSTIKSIEASWKKALPDYPFEFSFLDEDFDQAYWRIERMGKLLGYFAFLAVLIACLGLFGLASFTAEQRTKEIGIRKILGASAAGLTYSLCREFAKWVFLANIIAWPLAYFVARKWLNDFAYRTGPTWGLFVFTGILALGIALLTVSFQAMKAARANPVDALQYE